MTSPTLSSYTDRPARRPVPAKSTYVREVYLEECAIRGIEYGFCWCGCGEKTALAESNDRSCWKIKGMPRMFICGHAQSINFDKEYEVRDCGYKTPCWIWMRGRNKGRYGLTYGIARRTPGDKVPMSSHRLMYERHKGPVSPNCDLDHLCRVTLCCNPEHVEPVSHEENVRRGKNTRLSPKDVLEMFALEKSGWTQKEIAVAYGVSHSHVCKVMRGVKWKGVITETRSIRRGRRPLSMHPQTERPFYLHNRSSDKTKELR